MNTSNLLSRLHQFISASLSKADRLKFWMWWFEQPEQEKSLFQYWNQIDAVADESTYASLTKITSRINAKKHKFSFYFFTRIAIMLLLPIAMGAFTYYYVNSIAASYQLVEYVIRKGETRELLLSDGTKVFLNAETTLLCPEKFNGETRTVYLTGEANFDVSKDPDHPFIVKTSQMSIRVLGTKFNIRAYPESSFRTTLESGVVQATNAFNEETPITLYPDEQLEYDLHSGKFIKRRIDAKAVGGWIKDEYTFIRQSLPEIVAAVERRYNVKIFLGEKVDKSDRYTVKLCKGESLENAIKIISLTCGNLKVYHEDATIIQLNK